MSSMTPLQESLIVLTGLKNMLERALRSFYNMTGSHLSGRPGRLSDPFLCFSMQNYLLILLSSFLEEWRRFSSFAKDDSDVRETLRQVAPAMDRFKGWKDLRSVRSKLLAHPSRGTDGKVVLAWDVFRTSDAPTTFGEVVLLSLCVLIVIDRVSARHSQDRTAAERQLLQLDRSVPRKGLTTSGELEAELARIQAAMNQQKP